MMEQEHVANKIYKSFPFVGLVFGTHSLHHFPELMYNALLDGKRVFERGNDDNQLYEGFPVKRDGTSRVGYRLCTVATTSVHIALCLM